MYMDANTVTAQHATPEQGDVVLRVEGLKTYFFTSMGIIKAVDDFSLTVRAGQTVAVVGESGCGKSMTALSIMRLIPDPPGRIVAGRIEMHGQNLLDLPESAMRKLRGNEASMIFQEPMTSLNPLMTIGQQICETVLLHEKVTRKQAMARAVEMLRLVKIPEPERRVREYPHQLSGGMRQRVMAAIALACRPKVLIADEPTTALDVTIQAQILALMQDLQTRLGTAVLMITHDLGVVAENAQHVIVMYGGRKVEEASVGDVFDMPLHPYTRGLMAAVPRLDKLGCAEHPARLQEIPGMVPALVNLPEGCTFAPRCPHATERCRAAYPPLVEHRPGHWAACWEAPQFMEQDHAAS